MTTIEEMADIDVLCNDKARTLTLNKLTIDKNLVIMSVIVGHPTGFPLNSVIRRQENSELVSKVESMGLVNYGSHMLDQKDVLSPVYLIGNILKGRNLRLEISTGVANGPSILLRLRRNSFIFRTTCILYIQ